MTFHLEAAASLEGAARKYFLKIGGLDIPIGAKPVDEQIFKLHEVRAKKRTQYTRACLIIPRQSDGSNCRRSR